MPTYGYQIALMNASGLGTNETTGMRIDREGISILLPQEKVAMDEHVQ